MKYLKFSNTVEMFRIPIEDIVFIKAEGNYSNIKLANGTELSPIGQLHKFVDIFSNMREECFVRVGKSLVVNKNYIYSLNINTQMLLIRNHHLSTEFKVKVSREALKELKAALETEKD